jgi:hypothetical protein
VSIDFVCILGWSSKIVCTAYIERGEAVYIGMWMGHEI